MQVKDPKVNVCDGHGCFTVVVRDLLHNTQKIAAKYSFATLQAAKDSMPEILKRTRAYPFQGEPEVMLYSGLQDHTPITWDWVMDKGFLQTTEVR